MLHNLQDPCIETTTSSFLEQAFSSGMYALHTQSLPAEQLCHSQLYCSTKDDLFKSRTRYGAPAEGWLEQAPWEG